MGRVEFLKEYSKWQNLEYDPYLNHRAFLFNFLYKKFKFPEQDGGEDGDTILEVLLGWHRGTGAQHNYSIYTQFHCQVGPVGASKDST